MKYQNSGYEGGRKMEREMNGGDRVSVRGYSRGGPVKHDDVAQDRKMVKAMVKPSALKKGK